MIACCVALTFLQSPLCTLILGCCGRSLWFVDFGFGRSRTTPSFFALEVREQLCTHLPLHAFQAMVMCVLPRTALPHTFLKRRVPSLLQGHRRLDPISNLITLTHQNRHSSPFVLLTGPQNFHHMRKRAGAQLCWEFKSPPGPAS